MKPLISILFIFCSFVSYSQTSISDTLVIYTGFGSEEVILNKDFTFKYRDNSCTYHNEGIGLYAIENDKLVLLFETPKVIIKDTIKPSTYFIKDVNYDSAQKVNLEFCITDSDNMPLSKATINLKNLGRGAFTKDDGSAKIRNIEKNQIIQLKVSYIVMNTLNFDIFTDTSKYIEIKMVDQIRKIYWFETGYTREFKISKIIPDGECHYLKNKKGTLFLINERY